MCCVCRGRFQKNELIRIAKLSDEVSLDYEYNAGGRGAYICKNPSCLNMAEKKKSLSRSLKTDVGVDVYNSLSVLTE